MPSSRKWESWCRRREFVDLLFGWRQEPRVPSHVSKTVEFETAHRLVRIDERDLEYDGGVAERSFRKAVFDALSPEEPQLTFAVFRAKGVDDRFYAVFRERKPGSGGGALEPELVDIGMTRWGFAESCGPSAVLVRGYNTGREVLLADAEPEAMTGMVRIGVAQFVHERQGLKATDIREAVAWLTKDVSRTSLYSAEQSATRVTSRAKRFGNLMECGR